MAAADYKVVAKLRPEGQQIILELRDPTTGDTIATYGNVDINLTDLTGTNKFAKFRALTVCEDGVEKTIYALCTAPE